MNIFPHHIRALCILACTLIPITTWAADIDQFVGTYIGEADVTIDGEAQARDMSVMIAAEGNGFTVRWTSVTYKIDSDAKSKTYTIEFVPSQRDGIYGSAMKSNMFGKQVPLDPLQGEPFVWARFEDDTLSVFSLYINEVGEYEMQEYHRTLVDAGLDLVFRRVSNGVSDTEITAFLEREE